MALAAYADASHADADAGDDRQQPPSRSGIRIALDDTGQYFTSPLRWDAEDWSYFGAAVVAVVAAHQFDADARSHFAVGANSTLNGGKDKNTLRDAVPAVGLVLGTWATAGYLGDPDGYSETWRLVEAGALGTVTSEVLAVAGGRERPDGTTSPNQWRKSGDSFPSAHTTAAFAIGMTFAESGNDDYRWLRRILGYGIAGGTAYIRMKDNVHWLSDTVAGAALGIATARFVLNRENGPHGDLSFAPQKGGWMIAYSVPLR